MTGQRVSPRADIAVTRPWLRAGTALVAATMGRVDDADLRGPSGLPGWSRAHVVAHLARNAEALGRLVAWASTGVETPMYPSAQAREADIERSAQAPAAVLRAELVATADALERAFDELDADTWVHSVRSALGRPLPATGIPWMRVREVWLHAVDLDAGTTMGDIDPAVVDALLDDVTPTLSVKPDCPAVWLAPIDRPGGLPLGPDADRVQVRGTAADLLGWVLGRTSGAALTAAGGIPALPRWI